MTVQTGNDGFAYSEHFAEDLIPDAADFENVPVDPENPGFASLLSAIRGVRMGEYSLEILRGYVEGLGPRIDAAYSQLDTMLGKVEEMGFSEEQLGQLQAAMGATEAALSEMSTVLELCERSLDNEDLDPLDEAESRLALVHAELKQVL